MLHVPNGYQVLHEVNNYIPDDIWSCMYIYIMYILIYIYVCINYRSLSQKSPIKYIFHIYVCIYMYVYIHNVYTYIHICMYDHIHMQNVYRVAKNHRMPYLYRPFSAREPYT